MPRIASKATKGKGKRWLKGHSSTSNPELKKHRAKATQALSGISNGAGQVVGSNKFKLTKDLLHQFDAIQQQKLRMKSADGVTNLSSDGIGVSDWLNNQPAKINFNHNDNENVAGNRFLNDDAISLGNVSAASIWSNCTNVSFDRFLNGFDPKSKMHKSMLTVLATIREAIGKESGKESETEYFAGLMIALNCVDSEEKLTATLALIQMVLKRVPVSVLKLKFNETASALMKILNERINSQSHNGYLIKSIISALSILLQNQDRPVWEQALTQKIFETLLSLILHIKPRVRKAATFSIISIVGNIDGDFPDSGIRVARRLLAEFCISKLKEHLTTTNDEHLHILLYILSLLSDTLFLFPSVKHTQKACETILTHMKLGKNVLVVNSSMQSFYSFFLRRPKPNVLSADLNGQLMNALYEFQPNMNDEQPLNAWCIALKECLLSLHQLDQKLSYLHLSKFIQTALNCLQSDSSQVHACICNAIKVTFTTIVQKDFPSDLLGKLYAELESSLKYQFSQAWINVIPMLSELFIDNEATLKSLSPIIQRLAILHESNDVEINKAIDNFFGKAVAFYGPQAIVKHCPIIWRTSETGAQMIQDSEFRGEFTNPWLLPILRDYTQDKAHLALFVEHFLPLAEDISRKSIACKKVADQLRLTLSNQMETDANDVIFRAHESLLVAQRELKRCVHALWALLPAFCKNPVDVPQVFSKIAQKLGQTLNDRDLFSYPLAALRYLLKCSCDVTDIIAPFAKNYVAILFNLLTNENENTQVDQGMRAPMLILVQEFIPHLFVNEVSTQYFRKQYEQIRKFLNQPCSDFRKNALLDLLGAMLVSPKGFQLSDIEDLYLKLAKPLIEESKSTADQKKGCKIIEKIIQSDSPDCAQFIKDNLDQQITFLYTLVSDKKTFTAPSTRAFAFRTIRCLVEKYLEKTSGATWMQFFEKILPCVLDCLLLKSAKAKKSAENMLLIMAYAYNQLDWTDIEQSELITHKLINQIIDPLRQNNSSSLPISERAARLCAINLLYVHEYSSLAPEDLQCDIADVVLSQISPTSEFSSDRHIINICFEFIVNFFRRAKPDMLNSYLEMITCSITNLPQQHRTKYRLKIRTVLVKLVRKYGYDFIASMISEDYHKVLKNIKKFEERKKTKKTEEHSDGSENESNIELDRKSRRSFKASKYADSSDEDEAEVEQFIDNEWANGKDDDDDDDEKTLFKGKSNLDIMSRLSTKATKSFIREEVEGDPFDLLSTQANRNVFTKIPKKYKQTGETTASQEENKKLPIGDDGRIMINELLDQIEAKDGDKSGRAKKRTRNEVSDEQSDDDELDDKKTIQSAGKSNYKPGGRGIHRALSVSGESVGARSNRSTKSKASRKSMKSRSNGPSINRGDAYQSKNAAGDMKRRGMPDPYAYIPLNPLALNKRKSLKYKGEFKAIVKGAKKGAAAGSRSRKRMKPSGT